jgi:CP family cyanate transporter-like MFS transporter
MPTAPHQTVTGKLLLIAGILLIAANLRAPITMLPMVLSPLTSAFDLTTMSAGALTTLPLLAFAIISPFSAGFARRFGLERTLFIALLAIIFGIALRSAGTIGSLYAGTCVIGIGIAFGNVLLPALVKRYFPHSLATVTSAYALAMGIAAAAASVIVVPVNILWGWQVALASFVLIPLVALIIWIPQFKNAAEATETATHRPQGTSVWTSLLAWQVTLFLGLNSVIYYTIIGWLPRILMDGGLSSLQAGSLHGTLQLATAVPGFFIAPVLRRFSNQTMPAALVALCSATALFGLILAPKFAFFWVILFGIGGGTWFILAISFIAMRSRTAHEAASLSGMAQCVGYLLAATGPIIMGALHDWFNSWSIPLAFCAILALIAMFAGIPAGRNRTLY